MGKQYSYAELTRKVIGCAMDVHDFLGNGFQEVIYQKALALDMENQKIGFAREFEMHVMYKNHQVGTRRVDFLVEENASVARKALIHLEKVHMAQVMNYLEAYNLEVGLLINFDATRLEFHRFQNKKFKPHRVNLKHP
jgi:GxxExxY protein